MTNPLTRLLLIAVSVINLNLIACTEEPGAPGRKEPVTAGQEKAANADSSTQAEQAVRDRATAYLEALRLNDLAGAYRMEAGFLDGSLTPLVFRETATPFGGTLLSYTITAITLQGEEAIVDAEVSYQLPQLRKPYATKMPMRWVSQKGEYYHKHQQPPEFPVVPPVKAANKASQGTDGAQPVKIQ